MAGWIVFLLGLLMTQAAVAAPSACAPYSKPIALSFETTATPVNYNNNLNVTGIRNLFRSHGGAVVGPHTEALGVTFVTPVLSFEVRTRLEPVGNGACVYVEGVEVGFGFRNHDVYIASEYRPGSCEYRTILDHENQHVAINRGALQESAPRLRQTLEGLLTDLKPVFTMNKRQATQQIVDGLSRQMDPSVSAFQNALSQRNAAIDTASNYAATATLCKEWDRGNVWPQTQNRSNAR